jgi:cob(I)alamin adenosyltransferase
LHELQSELFALGAELARVPGKDVELGIDLLGDAQIERIEHTIDALDRDLPQLKSFILPGGTSEAAALHVARAVCRRAERALVALSQTQSVRPELLRYLNRLGDLLFIAARHANFRAKLADIPWLGRDSH